MQEPTEQVIWISHQPFVGCFNGKSKFIDESLLGRHQEVSIRILTWNDVPYSLDWNHFYPVELLKWVIHSVILLDVLICVDSHLVEFLMFCVQDSKAVAHGLVLRVLVLVVVALLNVELVICFCLAISNLVHFLCRFHLNRFSSHSKEVGSNELLLLGLIFPIVLVLTNCLMINCLQSPRLLSTSALTRNGLGPIGAQSSIHFFEKLIKLFITNG